MYPQQSLSPVLYEHGVVAQATAVAGPQGTTSAPRKSSLQVDLIHRLAAAPPWFQGAIQQLHVDLQNDMQSMMRAEILPDLKRVCCSPSFLDIADFQLL